MASRKIERSNYSPAPTVQPDLSPYLLNVYIRNAALNKQPVFDSFKRLCKIQAKPNFDYVDFEWKYYQFYNGNQDLTIERSPENSSPLTFADLSKDVLEMVVEKSSLVDRLVLRKVTPDLRNVIDIADAYCEMISFETGERVARIALEDLTITYESYRQLKAKRGIKEKTYYEWSKKSEEAMVLDAATILKNPNLKIGTLKLGADRSSELTAFLKLLNSLGFQLNVKRIDISKLPLMKLSEIFDNFQPKVLEEISWNLHSNWPWSMEDLVEMEHWKQAKVLHWKGLSHAFPMVAHLMLPRMLHFQKIRLAELELSAENLNVLKILLKSTCLQWCSVEFTIPDSVDPSVFARRVLSQDPAYDQKKFRYPIPNSNGYFKMGFEKLDEKFSLVIEKANKN